MVQHRYRCIATSSSRCCPGSRFTAIVLTGMGAIRAFDIVAAMSGSGQAFSTDTLAFHMFEQTFLANRYSLSAVIGVGDDHDFVAAGDSRISSARAREAQSMTPASKRRSQPIAIRRRASASMFFWSRWRSGFCMPIYVLVNTSLKGFEEVNTARMWAAAGTSDI